MADLRFGIIGTGHFGKHYVRLVKEIPGVALAGTANNSSESEEILRSPEIDCVVIASPASTHFHLASQAILAGKHVLLEKPMVLTTNDAQSLKKTVDGHDKVFMVGHQYLFNNYINFLKQKIDGGLLGEIRYIFAEHLYFGPIRNDIGAFWDAAPHNLAILDYLFGPLQIEDVQGMTVSFSNDLYDDYTAAEIRYDNNLVLTLIISRFAPQKRRTIIVAGEQGSAIFDDCLEQNKLTFLHQSYPSIEQIKTSSYFITKNLNDEESPKIKAIEPLRNQMNHFIECVRENKKPLTDTEHGMRVHEHLDLIYKHLQKSLK